MGIEELLRQDSIPDKHHEKASIHHAKILVWGDYKIVGEDRNVLSTSQCHHAILVHFLREGWIPVQRPPCDADLDDLLSCWHRVSTPTSLVNVELDGPLFKARSIITVQGTKPVSNINSEKWGKRNTYCCTSLPKKPPVKCVLSKVYENWQELMLGKPKCFWLTVCWAA